MGLVHQFLDFLELLDELSSNLRRDVALDSLLDKLSLLEDAKVLDELAVAQIGLVHDVRLLAAIRGELEDDIHGL